MAEKLANLGYMSLGLEGVKGEAITPTTEIPLYSEAISVNLNVDKNETIVGNKARTYLHHMGQRDYTGTFTVLAEPITAPHILNMLLTMGTTSNSGSVYTHPFTLDPDTDPKSYTIDFKKGAHVHRYYGVEAKSITPEFVDNKMHFTVEVSALGHFSLAPISTGTGTQLVLDTGYDPSPTSGLHVNDTLVLVKPDTNYTEEVTISSIDDETTITTSAMAGTYDSDDYCYIKVQTPSYSIGDPFHWARTEFRFGATASAALSASHTPLEVGSTYKLMHDFANDGGEKRSGSYNPSSLARISGDAEYNIKKYLDDDDQQERFLTLEKEASVIRHFGSSIDGTTNNELRVTFNHLKIVENPSPLEFDSLIYYEQTLSPQWDSDDGQLFDVKVINDQAGSVYNAVIS